MDFEHEIISSNQDISVKFQYFEDKGSTISKHWHRSLEIIYLLTGSLEVNVNGVDYNLNENDLIVINSLEIHSTVCKYGNTAVVLQIPYQFCENYIDDMATTKFICNPNTTDKMLSLNQLKEILFDFFQIYNKKSQGYKLKINSLIFNSLFILVSEFSRKDKKFDTKKSDKYLNRLALILDYVKEHYSEHITLESAASELYLNQEYFSRFFKKYMGTTFLKYLNTVRLEHAYIDIVNSDNTISQIMEKNGFTNDKMFIKLFKDKYGCSPNEKRKQLKINNN
ncbi:AraC family transcriptional regulator [Clostridium sp.]|uniref:AraC family transcriptional regulator n=1 Tax=Clostridium sp. TaxID=1506 RepID=UPI00283D4A5F|nr:AraC family transcriptional regulator [Clostridium sp.]MDR3596845.1 AraC family transcriptional regulator [Clostridium sp.]